MTWTRTQLQNMKEAMEAIAKDIPSTEEQQKMTQYWQQQANKQALSEEQRQAAGYIVNGGLTKSIQMQKKVQADSLSYQLTRRQFEEGLSTAIDVHTTSAQLLNSKATLLQCQLMAMVKEQLVRYYKGETIWTE